MWIENEAVNRALESGGGDTQFSAMLVKHAQHNGICTAEAMPLEIVDRRQPARTG